MNNRPVQKKDVTCRQLDESETMLYDPETEALHVLNATARLIWENCDGKHTAEDMVAIIKTRYAGGQDSDVLRDVQATLDTFAARGLLQSST